MRTSTITMAMSPEPRGKAAADTAGGAESLEPAALYRLMSWFSASYPIGAFSYSSGIEWAVEAGDITNAATLQSWLAVMIGDGGGFCDAIFFVHAYSAAASGDDVSLREIAELAVAFAPSKERQLETTAQGEAFLAVTRAAWPSSKLDRLAAVAGEGAALPVAAAVACAAHGVPLRPALHCYVQAFAASLVSAGVRLIPLGQSDGQRVLAALEALVTKTAVRALATPLDEVGGAAMRADLASMHHETQYTRLFRS
jgi:urease accessory protein